MGGTTSPFRGQLRGAGRHIHEAVLNARVERWADIQETFLATRDNLNLLELITRNMDEAQVTMFMINALGEEYAVVKEFLRAKPNVTREDIDSALSMCANSAHEGVFANDLPPEPRTAEAARASPEKEFWEKAVSDEISGLVKHGVWVEADLPPYRQAVGTKWVFWVQFTMQALGIWTAEKRKL
ncbi:unnamed protein product [Discosporangium mesarthrocarpum]